MTTDQHWPDKVWVIGLDGATLSLIQPWAKAGYLPTLARLMNEGAWGELESTIHPLTAPAWTSFMTGQNPGQHGIFDFTRRHPGRYRLDLMNATSRSTPSLWHILGEAGRSVGVVNVPMTYPPEAVNGYLVSGLDTPGVDSPYTFPPTVARDLRGLHLVSVSTLGKSLTQYLHGLLSAVDRRFQVIDMLLRKQPTDFFMKVIVEIDAIQHAAWHLLSDKDAPNSSAILQIYRRVDQRLGKLLATMPSDVTLMIMSDHGAGPIEKVVHLDRWLQEQGLLCIRKPNPLRRWPRRWALTLLKAAQRHLPQRVKGILKQSTNTISHLDSYLLFSEIDWAKTKAFSIGNQGNICINLAGREPQGIVAESDYESLRQAIIDRLSELRDPDNGKPIVQRVYRREELYHGSQVPLAPDLLIRWCDDKYLAKKDFAPPTKGLFSKSLGFGRNSDGASLKQTGTHQLYGTLILYGSTIKHGVHITGSRLTDLAPTILYLMDEQVPQAMEGRVLFEVLDDDFIASRSIRNNPSVDQSPEALAGGYTAEDEELVRQRLQGLGYVSE